MAKSVSEDDPVAAGHSLTIAFSAGGATIAHADLDMCANFNGVIGRYGRVTR